MDIIGRKNKIAVRQGHYTYDIDGKQPKSVIRIDSLNQNELNQFFKKRFNLKETTEAEVKSQAAPKRCGHISVITQEKN